MGMNGEKSDVDVGVVDVGIGVLLDRRNFAKKMLSLGYIVPTGKVVADSRNRPPLLYTFDEEAYKNAKRKGMKLEF